LNMFATDRSSMAGSALKTFDSALPIWGRDFLNGNG
jgi:hypothetical protein